MREWERQSERCEGGREREREVWGREIYLKLSWKDNKTKVVHSEKIMKPSQKKKMPGIWPKKKKEENKLSRREKKLTREMMSVRITYANLYFKLLQVDSAMRDPNEGHKKYDKCQII